MKTVGVIPAAPGYFVLEPYYQEIGKPVSGYDREPIIAWQLLVYTEDESEVVDVVPICVDDCSDVVNGDRAAILCPDGSVIKRGSQSWKSVEQFMACQEKQT